jgi:hypothetical protein
MVERIVVLGKKAQTGTTVAYARAARSHPVRRGQLGGGISSDILTRSFSGSLSG